MTSFGPLATLCLLLLQLGRDLVLRPQSQVEELVLEPQGAVVHVRDRMAFAVPAAAAPAAARVQLQAHPLLRCGPGQRDRRPVVQSQVLQTDQRAERGLALHIWRVAGRRRVGRVRLERVMLARGQSRVRDQRRRRLQEVDQRTHLRLVPVQDPLRPHVEPQPVLGRPGEQFNWFVHQEEDLGQIPHDRSIRLGAQRVSAVVEFPDLSPRVVQHPQEVFGIRPQLVQLPQELVPRDVLVDQFVADGLFAASLAHTKDHAEDEDETENGAKSYSHHVDEEGVGGSVIWLADPAHVVGHGGPLAGEAPGTLVDAFSGPELDQLRALDAGQGGGALQTSQEVRGTIWKREEEEMLSD